MYLGSCLINKHTTPSNSVCYLHFICSQFTWEITTNHLCCGLRIPASVLAKSELSFNNKRHHSRIPTALKSFSPPRSQSRLYYTLSSCYSSRYSSSWCIQTLLFSAIWNDVLWNINTYIIFNRLLGKHIVNSLNHIVGSAWLPRDTRSDTAVYRLTAGQAPQ